jgi:hypothetical protein
MVDRRPAPTILQFLATLETRNPEDKIREFVVAFYAEDRAFIVYENHVPNSGFRGGKFLQKQIVNNPKTGAPYEATDIYVGAQLDLLGWHFVLQDASEDALKVMEARSDVFEKSDLAAIIGDVRKRIAGKAPQLLVEFQKKDAQRRERLSSADAREVLAQFGFTFGNQEFLTLFRRYQFCNSDYFSYEDFVKNLV